jgi:hypothetical protein
MSDVPDPFDPSGLPAALRLPEVLYGIGAQKSGTTWLYDVLKAHPDCHCSDTKELHYFDVLHLKGERTHLDQRLKLLERLRGTADEQGAKTPPRLHNRIARLESLVAMYPERSDDHTRYLNVLLSGYKGQKVACDITPSYATLDRSVFCEMASIAPARFLFVMRDPVDRMWSQIRMAISTEISAESPDLFSAACLKRVYDLHASGRLQRLPRANYARTLTELEAAVESHQRMCIFFESMFNAATVGSLWDFLGVRQHAAKLPASANPGRCAALPPDAEALLFEGLREQYDFVFQKFGQDVPEAWRERYGAASPRPKGWFGSRISKIFRR